RSARGSRASEGRCKPWFLRERPLPPRGADCPHRGDLLRARSSRCVGMSSHRSGNLSSGSRHLAVYAFERRPALIVPKFNFLWEVPAPLVSRLARVNHAELPQLGATWAVAFRAELLRRLSTFAKDAVASGQGVFEWAYE